MTDVLKRVLLVCVVLALPLRASAQEAVLTGAVTDSTGAVLPGVTILAVNDATGNRFETVTDERGLYRIPARVGTYQLSAELAGFTRVARAVSLLVGQTATVNLQMAPSTVQETVTVTAEAPLLNVTTSSLGGNVDPQQVQELPVAGRNWMALALLAPGSRTASANATSPLPDRQGGNQREFQLNLDGQQISGELGTGAQPRFSQDSIAEFQFISNRFDATQGRSTGVQVNAITKSGTNRLSGLFRANFRDSRLNAPNPVLGRVVPQKNQQYSTTLGGPLLRDKLHYFGNFEYEREPRSSIWNTAYPAFNITLSGKSTRKLAGLRMDYQLSPDARVMGKVSGQRGWEPFGGGASGSHPAATGSTDEHNTEYLGQFTQVLGNRALNEIKGGWAHYGFDNRLLTEWSRHWQAPRVTNGHPRITFTGFTITGNANYPRHRDQKVTQLRDDFTLSYDMRGRHDMRAGAEFVHHYEDSENCAQCGGTIDARGTFGGAAIPSPAQLQAWFPDPFNTDTWNLRDFPLGADVHHRCRQVPEPVWAAEVRRLAAGRLAHRRRPDAEPRRPVRPEPQCVGERLWTRAVLRIGPPRRHQQPATQARVCISDERADRHPRRHRHLLRRRADRGCVLADLQHNAGAHRDSERREAEFCGRSAEWPAAADLRRCGQAVLQRA
jgi:hypothetical protein